MPLYVWILIYYRNQQRYKWITKIYKHFCERTLPSLAIWGFRLYNWYSAIYMFMSSWWIWHWIQRMRQTTVRKLAGGLLSVEGLTSPEWDKWWPTANTINTAAAHRSHCIQDIKPNQTSQINSSSYTFPEKILYLSLFRRPQQLILTATTAAIVKLHIEWAAHAQWATEEDRMSWAVEWIWSRMLRQSSV